MIEITASVESPAQAEALLEAGVDNIVFGEADFALRLPATFDRDEQKQLVKLAHQYGKKAAVAVNGLMHQGKMKDLPAYLAFIGEIGADAIIAGDPGVIYLLQKNQLNLPFIYDGETLATNPGQMSFWSKKGAVGAVLAREVPFEEMAEMADKLVIPAEVLVYGASCIHQSKRPLLTNYYMYKGISEGNGRGRDLFLSDPEDDATHYSIYEDSHGTHIFASNDLNLIRELPLLYSNNYRSWKLEGLFTPGKAFVEIAKIFIKARDCIEKNAWSETAADDFDNAIHQLHPSQRGLDQGFFYIDSQEIK